MQEIVMDVSVMRPKNNLILIRRLPIKEKTASGIVRPTELRETWVQIVRVGPGRRNAQTNIPIPMCPLKRGDWAIARAFEGVQFKGFLAADGWEYAFIDDRLFELKLVRKKA